MPEPVMYGGQAVIEGVMMRSPDTLAIACRRPDGQLVVHSEPVRATLMGRLTWLNRPFLRGTFAILDAIVLGMKALAFAANVQAAAEAERTAAASRAAGKNPSRSELGDIAIGATLVLSLAVGLLLFVALPTALTQLVQDGLNARSAFVRNVVDGFFRVAIFLAYVFAISLLHNIRRVFQYHGAEHKAINTLENGQPLTLENALQQSRLHPRCGTSFVVVVLLAAILVHTLFPRPDNVFLRIGLHLLLLPLVAGVAYETIRWAGRARNQLFLRALLAPGLWSQRLTTREPEPDQVEVAIAALRGVMEQQRLREPTSP